MSKKPPPPITIMVSSTVYGSEDVLDRVYDLLTSFGYEVWMSHKGTLPVFSNKSAFENCLEGVRQCRVFLGIIGTRYGTGLDKNDPDSLSIVHQELRLAIESSSNFAVIRKSKHMFVRALRLLLHFQRWEANHEIHRDSKSNELGRRC